MKKTRTLVALALALFAVLALSGCMLDAMEVGDTMGDFVLYANTGAWGALQQLTHTGAGDYATADASFWETALETYTPLIVGLTTDSSAIVTGGGATFTFTLMKDGDDMKIRIIMRGGTIIFD